MADKPDAHADITTVTPQGQHTGAPTPTPHTDAGSLDPNVRPVAPVQPAPRGVVTNPTLRSAQPQTVQARTVPNQTTTPQGPSQPAVDPLEQSLTDLRGQLAAVQGLPQYAAEQRSLEDQIFQTEQTLNQRRAG